MNMVSPLMAPVRPCEPDLLTNTLKRDQFVNFCNPNSTFWTFFPHRYFSISEEKNIDFSWHFICRAHVRIVIEKLFKTRNFAKWLELIFVTNFLVLFFLIWILLGRLSSHWSLIIPEFPTCMQWMRIRSFFKILILNFEILTF